VTWPWTTSASKMVNVLPRPFVHLTIPACVVGEISLEITLIGQDQVEELVARELDPAMITRMAQIKVRDTVILQVCVC
jgi:hypothetical protein